MNMKPGKIIVLLTLLFASAAFAQNTISVDLAKTAPSWTSVLGGNALCQPVRTSYGYVLIGEGKQVTAINSSGTLLWQKTFTQRPQPFLSVTYADMLYIVTGSSNLNMLNPGGVTLWTSNTGFSITEAPKPGSDGRVFVRGKDYVACYGLKGVCRWKEKIDSQKTDIPLTVLNDGSLLVFLNRTSNGKSIARRISPFGVVSEDITFAGTVKNAVSCSDGVLITFTDGSIGLCAANEEGTYSAWGLQTGNQGLSGNTQILVQGMKSSTAAVITGNPASVILINTKNGNVLSSFSTTQSASDIKNLHSTVQGIILTDPKQVCCYSLSGQKIWSASLSPKKQLYTFATDSGYLISCSSDWSVYAYRMKQTLSSSSSSFTPVELKPYKNFYKKQQINSSFFMGQAISGQLYQEMITGFTKGNFKDQEQTWLPLLQQEIACMQEDWMKNSKDHGEKPYFQSNLAYNEIIFTLTAESGLGIWSKSIAGLIKRISDPSLQLALIRKAGSIGFDPTGDMLESLEYVLKKSSTAKDLSLLEAICDSTYEICRYMGRPAFYERGEEMLTYLLYPQFNSKTKDYARSTLKKLMDLKL